MITIALVTSCTTPVEKAARVCAFNTLQAFYEKEVGSAETGGSV